MSIRKLTNTSTDVDESRIPASERLVLRPFLFLILEGARPLVPGARYDRRNIDRIFIDRGAGGDEREVKRALKDSLRVLHIALPSRFLSRAHATLYPSSKGWMIEDVGSTNGTFVNGQRIEGPTLLGPADFFEVGRAFFQLADLPVRKGDTEAGGELDLDGMSLSSKLPGLQTLVPTYGAALGHLMTIARSKEPIALIGETGSGKEVLAKAIHALSGRTGPFHAINCAAIPENLVESELFGFKKGAFSGAVGDSLGHFRSSQNGTLLLDEILRTDLKVQHSLLRVLDEHVITPVGSSQPVPVDVRIVAASQEPLGSAVERGRFQADLQSRLEGFRFNILPLRERRADLGIIISHLLSRLGVHPNDEPTFSPTAALRILQSDWPLNIRALDKALRSSWHLAKENGGLISEEQFPERKLSNADRSHQLDDFDDPERIRSSVLSAVKESGGNISKAAGLLGVNRRSVYRWIERYSISLEGDSDAPANGKPSDAD